ncbi:uncharacterized protein LOC113277808 [Papaver somniferum]|uniref:uncharacterized protein LOC113277808 n=1 Tax=Papaver somniferum TaxID=3469 RepID=UPI000E6F5698|nr:uncharacterized protein LOC113277808 [Papaver somniferum]
MPPRKVVNVQSKPKSKKRNKRNNGTSERRDEEEVPHASNSSISLSPASISNEKHGGPQDMSLLITYKDPIASRIWSGEMWHGSFRITIEMRHLLNSERSMKVHLKQ